MIAYLQKQKRKTDARLKIERLQKAPELVEEISGGDAKVAEQLAGRSYAELICIRRSTPGLPGTNWWDGGDDGPRAA